MRKLKNNLKRIKLFDEPSDYAKTVEGETKVQLNIKNAFAYAIAGLMVGWFIKELVLFIIWVAMGC